MFNRVFPKAGVVCVALVLSTSLLAAVHDRTADGISFIECGVGGEEVSELEAERLEYSLWVKTAARGSS